MSIIPPNFPTAPQDSLAGVTEGPPDLYWPIDAVFGSTGKEARGRGGRSKSPSYSLRSPPELLPTRSSKPQQLPQPCKLDRDQQDMQYLERSLPVLPHTLSRGSSVDSPSPRTTRSRSSSGIASIATSLLSFIDDLSNGFEDAEVVTAESTSIDRFQRPKVIDIHNPRNTVHGVGSQPISSDLDRPLPEPPRSSSPSDYSASPPASESSQLSPTQKEYLPTTGSALDRHLADLSPLNKTRGRAISDTVMSVVHVTIPEAQWMRPGQRTPSPLRRRQTQIDLNLLAANHADALKAKGT